MKKEKRKGQKNGVVVTNFTCLCVFYICLFVVSNKFISFYMYTSPMLYTNILYKEQLRC